MRQPTSLDPAVSTVSSIEAYVLPEVVLVEPTIGGVVTRVFVRERDAVAREQDLLEKPPAASPRRLTRRRRRS